MMELTEAALELLELKSGLVVSRRAGSLDAGARGLLEGGAVADAGEIGAVKANRMRVSQCHRNQERKY